MSSTIASITAFTHFPHGVDLHVRNLKWFLGSIDYQIYIVTLPKVLEQIKTTRDRVSFITKPTPGDDFTANPQTGYVNFWKWFPAIHSPLQYKPRLVLVNGARPLVFRTLRSCARAKCDQDLLQ